MALGLANRHIKCRLAGSLAISAPFAVSVHGGVEAPALAYAIANYALFLPTFLFGSRGTGIGLGDFLGSVWRPALAAIAAGYAVTLLRTALPAGPPILLLVATTAAYGLSYLALLAMLPGGMRDLRLLFSRVLGAWLPQAVATLPLVP